MKYEIIFGDEKLFDCAPEDAEYAGWFCQEVRWYMILNGKILFSDGVSWCTSDNPYLSADIAAMRRIIQEPNRWTIEDQKAGRLPEVGCMVMVTSVDECASVAAINNDAVCVVFHDGEFTTLHKSGISPIETPEEKAERLRSEWCSECTSKYYPRGHKGFPEMIYDALLSGALSVPTKGGE